jgi:hypothetical protein
VEALFGKRQVHKFNRDARLGKSSGYKPELFVVTCPGTRTGFLPSPAAEQWRAVALSLLGHSLVIFDLNTFNNQFRF